MQTTYKNDSFTWIDLENPTKEEVRTIMDTYNLDPSVAEDLLDPTIETRTDQYKDILYFVLHFPLKISKKFSLDKRTEEIDFILGKNFLITIHYSPIPTFVSLQKALETESILHQHKKTKNVKVLFFYVVKKMYDDLSNKIEDIRTTLMDYEEKIFLGQEKEMIYHISRINQIIIYFRESLNSHTDFIDFIKNHFGKNEDIQKTTELILINYAKIKHSLQSVSSYAHELRETNNSLLSTKQNEVMKMLAIVSFITFPLTLLTSIFGMNTDYLPLVGLPFDFHIIMIIMIIMAIGFFLFFKNKKWL